MEKPQPPALISGKQFLYVKLKPPEVLKQLVVVRDDDLNIHISTDSFEVKLVNKHKIHGLASALLAYNPIRLAGKVQEYGYGSRVDFQIYGKLTIVESLLCIAFCTAMGVFIASVFGTNDMFHLLLAIFIVVVLPLGHISDRKNQEKKLSQFMTSHFQPLVVEDKNFS